MGEGVNSSFKIQIVNSSIKSTPTKDLTQKIHPFIGNKRILLRSAKSKDKGGIHEKTYDIEDQNERKYIIKSKVVI